MDCHLDRPADPLWKAWVIINQLYSYLVPTNTHSSFPPYFQAFIPPDLKNIEISRHLSSWKYLPRLGQDIPLTVAARDMGQDQVLNIRFLGQLSSLASCQMGKIARHLVDIKAKLVEALKSKSPQIRHAAIGALAARADPARWMR